MSDPARLRAGCEYFRAFPRDAADNAVSGRTKLPMPVLALGARGSLGKPVSENRVASHLRLPRRMWLTTATSLANHIPTQATLIALSD